MEEKKANSIENKIIDLTHRTHDFQEKFTYYILAVEAACIGFSVNLTKSDHKSLILFPIVLAVITWLVSFYCGLQELIYSDHTNKSNVYMLHSERMGNTTHEGLYKDEFDEFNKQIVRFRKYKLWTLYAGSIVFLVGYFLRIYTNC